MCKSKAIGPLRPGGMYIYPFKKSVSRKPVYIALYEMRQSQFALPPEGAECLGSAGARTIERGITLVRGG